MAISVVANSVTNYSIWNKLKTYVIQITHNSTFFNKIGAIILIDFSLETYFEDIFGSSVTIVVR